MYNPGYEVQDGCWNCRYVFVRTEYDESDEYYCARGREKRPKCGSMKMGEQFSSVENKDARGSAREWDRWSSGRSVAPAGKCDRWKLYTKNVDEFVKTIVCEKQR